jgi:flagellar motor switch protein FliM
MDSILTPSELEALMKPTESAPERTGPKAIDLVVRDHQAFAVLPDLQEAADRLADFFGKLCTQHLKAACRTTANPVEVVPGSSLPDLIGGQRFAFALKVNDSRNAGAVVIAGPLAGAFVARQFGGELDLQSVADGPPSPTEVRTVARLADQVLSAVRSAMAPVAPLDLSLLTETVSPLEKMARISAMVLIGLVVTIQDQKSTVAVAIDTSSAGFKVAAQARRGRRVFGRPFAPVVRHVPLRASAVLGRTTLTLRQFLGLAVGDVVPLDTSVDAELTLRIEGAPKFLGKPIISRGNISLELSKECTADGETRPMRKKKE